MPDTPGSMVNPLSSSECVGTHGRRWGTIRPRVMASSIFILSLLCQVGKRLTLPVFACLFSYNVRGRLQRLILALSLMFPDPEARVTAESLGLPIQPAPCLLSRGC